MPLPDYTEDDIPFEDPAPDSAPVLAAEEDTDATEEVPF